MAILSRPSCDIYYETSGEGPAIVFAHGAGGNHLSWWQQIPVFSGAYRCVAFDHRGWGRSIEQEGGPGPAAFVDDLIALLDELEIEKTALVAQSMGGWSCLGATLRQPERIAALVMADTLGGLTNPEIAAGAEVVAERQRREGHRGLGTMAYHPNLRERDPSMAFLYDEVMAMNPPLDGSIRQTLAALAPDPDAVAALEVPLLWVVGGEDRIFSPVMARAAQAHVPGSSYFEVPDTGHSVYFERPVQFNMQLNSFLVEAGWGESVF